MNLLSKKKPTVISMSDTAASGGYYMAMTGDPIVAYPGTYTGSIGVVFGKANLRGLYQKLGITKDSDQRGAQAGIDSDYTSLTPEQRRILKDGIDESYRDFVGKVATARHRPFDQIEPLAQGRVWLGSQARTRGLVDELGGFDTAIRLLKKKANIPDSENVSIEVYPPKASWFELLVGRTSKDSALEARLAPLAGRLPFRSWIKGGMLGVMPYWLEVR
jgi:protease-4